MRGDSQTAVLTIIAGDELAGLRSCWIGATFPRLPVILYLASLSRNHRTQPEFTQR